MSTFRNTFVATYQAVRAHGVKRTFGMLLQLSQPRVGTLVGVDRFGNEYFESKKDISGRGRWVLYKKWNFDGTQVPPEWHQWLHRVTDDAPANTPEKFVYPKFSPEHVEHLTGTTAAYKVYSTTRPKMEAWEPAVKPRE